MRSNLAMVVDNTIPQLRSHIRFMHQAISEKAWRHNFSKYGNEADYYAELSRLYNRLASHLRA